MRKSETQSVNAVELTVAVVLGGLLALAAALLVLTIAAAAVSAGVLREDIAPQVTAAACLLGCFTGGIFTCLRWKSRSLFGGLAVGAACYLLLLTVSLVTASDGLELGLHALTELACCLCGGGLAGLVCSRRGKRGPKHPVSRKRTRG